MTVDPFEQWLGTEMKASDTAELLDSAGWGILSLAEDDEPYSLPVSFGHSGEEIYFAFIRRSPSDTKFEFIHDGKTARLLVTDVDSRVDWRSVSVSGPVFSVERGSQEWVEMLDLFEDNAWFSSDFKLATMSQGLQGFRLEPEEVSGVQF